MTQLNSKKPLDNSSESGKVIHNNAMQPASQTNESPATAKKMPLTPKRIGLIRLTFLLVIGILLIPTKVTQNEAKANPYIETYTEDKNYIVRTVVSWILNEQLSKSKKEKLKSHGGITLDEDAQGKAEVSTAYWKSNSTTQIRKRNTWDSANQRYTGNWTTKTKMATQGHQGNTAPMGIKEDGTAMETDEARRFLFNARYTYKNTLMELFGRATDGTVYYIRDVAADGLEEYYEENKETQLKIWKSIYGDHVFFGPEFYIRTFTTNVDQHRMESKWDHGGWPTLGGSDGIYSGDYYTDKYGGKLTWKRRRFLSNGRFTREQTLSRVFDFKSWKDHYVDRWICPYNFVITEGPNINDSCIRKFENHGTTIKKLVRIPIPGTTVPNLVLIDFQGTKRVVVQQETVYRYKLVR